MLTETKIKSLRTTDKRERVLDADGLYIEAAPSGKRYWQYRCTNGRGKRTWLSLGEYPFMRLAEARVARDQIKKRLLSGLPAREERASKDTFRGVAQEWLGKYSIKWTVKTQNITRRRLEVHVYPVIGDMPIANIRALDLIRMVRQMEEDGIFETTRRVVQTCGQIFRYAVVCGYCENDPTPPLRGALAPGKPGHFASLTDPAAVGDLMRRIMAYRQPLVRNAMLLSAYTFCRPGEIRHAEWSEIAGDEWRIPAAKMKMRRVHIVPLSNQALAVLERLRIISGGEKYIFPANRGKGRPMSENTVLAAIRSLGYTKAEMTPHGFRSVASTLLNENGFHPDWIERQLAHVEGNSVRAAYNYAEYLPERRKMLQWWGDYLDRLSNC